MKQIRVNIGILAFFAVAPQVPTLSFADEPTTPPLAEADRLPKAYSGKFGYHPEETGAYPRGLLFSTLQAQFFSGITYHLENDQVGFAAKGAIGRIYAIPSQPGLREGGAMVDVSSLVPLDLKIEGSIELEVTEDEEGNKQISLRKASVEGPSISAARLQLSTPGKTFAESYSFLQAAPKYSINQATDVEQGGLEFRVVKFSLHSMEGPVDICFEGSPVGVLVGRSDIAGKQSEAAFQTAVATCEGVELGDVGRLGARQSFDASVQGLEGSVATSVSISNEFSLSRIGKTPLRLSGSIIWDRSTFHLIGDVEPARTLESTVVSVGAGAQF